MLSIGAVATSFQPAPSQSSNPTGGVATREQLAGISELILERTGPDVRVFSDESYEAITFDGERHVSIASMPGMPGVAHGAWYCEWNQNSLNSAEKSDGMWTR